MELIGKEKAGEMLLEIYFGNFCQVVVTDGSVVDAIISVFQLECHAIHHFGTTVVVLVKMGAIAAVEV